MSCVSWRGKVRRNTPLMWCWIHWSSGRAPAAAGVPLTALSLWAPSTESFCGPRPIQSHPCAAAPAPPATPWAPSSLQWLPVWEYSSNPQHSDQSPWSCPNPISHHRALLHPLRNPWTNLAPCSFSNLLNTMLRKYSVRVQWIQTQVNNGGKDFQEYTSCRSCRKLGRAYFVCNVFLKQQITKASFREIVKCKLPLYITASVVDHWTRNVTFNCVAHSTEWLKRYHYRGAATEWTETIKPLDRLI